MEFVSALSTGGLVACIVVPVVVVLLAIIIVVWYFSTKNSLISLRNDMEEAFSAMDVHMKKRHDLIPNLVETCKGYAKFESETLTKVTEARKVAVSAPPEERAKAESQLSAQLHTLLNVVKESYPELKASAQFNNLSSRLEDCEHEIANARKFFNAKVKLLNNKIEKFPSSIVANRMHLERKPYFELDDVSERSAPKVSF